MIKKYKGYRTKKTFKINENNNIDSIIETFQHFNKDYNVIATKLDENIQYETEHTKITQTYKTTLKETNINEITKILKDKGKITIIIIDNLKKKDKKSEKEINKKIRRINRYKNIKTKTIKQKDTIKTIKEILKAEGDL